MKVAPLAEGDHVVHALADSLGPGQRGHDAAVTDDLAKTTYEGEKNRHARREGKGRRR